MRLLILLVLLYVSADLANPLLPGVFSFDPDDTVDMSRGGEQRDLPAFQQEARAHSHPVEVALAPAPSVRDSAPAALAPATRRVRDPRVPANAPPTGGAAADPDH